MSCIATKNRLSLQLLHPSLSIGKDPQMGSGGHTLAITGIVKVQDDIYTVGQDGVLNGWKLRYETEKVNVVDLKLYKGARIHNDWINDLVCIPSSLDTMLLASASSDTTVKLFSTQYFNDDSTQEQERPFQPSIILRGHDDYVQVLNYSSFDSKLMSAGLDKRIIIWDVTEGVKIGSIVTNASIYSMANATEVELMVCGSYDKSISLWDTRSATNTPIGLFLGHTDVIRDLLISANGKRVISAASDGLVKIWDTRNFSRAVFTLDIHKQKSAWKLESVDEHLNAFYSSSITGNLFKITCTTTNTTEPVMDTFSLVYEDYKLHQICNSSSCITKLYYDKGTGLWTGNALCELQLIDDKAVNVVKLNKRSNLPTIIKCAFINGKRKILCMDSKIRFYLQDVLTLQSESLSLEGLLPHLPESSYTSNTTLMSQVQKERLFSFMLNLVNSKVQDYAVSWATINCKLGCVTLNVESESVFQGEAFLDTLEHDWKHMYQLKEKQYSAAQFPLIKDEIPEEQRINIGQLVLQYFFRMSPIKEKTNHISVTLEEYNTLNATWIPIITESLQGFTTKIVVFSESPPREIEAKPFFLPNWFLNCLFNNEIATDFSKHNQVFCLKAMPCEDAIESKNLEEGQRLTAHPMVRLKRLKKYLKDIENSNFSKLKISESKTEDHSTIRFYCDGIELDEKTTLGIVKYYFWKQSSDMVISYTKTDP